MDSDDSWPAPYDPRGGELAVGGSPMIGNRLRLATLPDASAYHCRVALRELSRHEVLQAVAEYDRLGQDRFLEKYGFGAARSYRLVVDGKTYDSKAIVGAAHGFLPGQEPLAPADFSGGAATVGRLLSSLGFQVTQAASGLTVGRPGPPRADDRAVSQLPCDQDPRPYPRAAAP